MNMAAVSRAQEPAPLVDIVIPVHNEQADLERSVRRLRTYLRHRFPFSARITIADNGSADGTWAIAQGLERHFSDVRAVHLPQKGRGGALASAWLKSDALVVAYMDVDLSTDLDALLPLVAPLISGHSDVSIGSRLAPGARVVRGPRRELISRCYNLLLHLTLRVKFRDAQCGFKAMRADAARRLLPRVEDRRWFSIPSCWYWLSAQGCASTRSRLTGLKIRTLASTSWPLPRKTCAESCGCPAGS